MKLLREPFFLLLLSGLLAGLVFLGLQPPQALPASAPATAFSADRALSILQALNKENLPHPAGSQQNQMIRERIQAQLQELDFEIQLQSLFHCNPKFGLCSPVENLIARLPGQATGSALLLTAHYDSVEAGPGMGDDGAGVAALLEIARMAVLRGGFQHDLIFLFSDAEEQGLVGADAFATQHAWFKDVDAVINLEARGVSGASSMFETGNGNRSFIRMLAQSLDRPVANSLSREVYRRMPNDTDFSVYRELGLSGFNFAFTGGAAVYHSAIDDSRELAAASLQHHGQNVWALLAVLDQRDLQRVTTVEDAVYVDLFGHKLLHYPDSSSAGLALVLAVLLLVLIRMTFRQQLSLRQSAWTLLFILLLLPLLLGLGWLLSWPLGHWPDLNRLGHPYPWLGRMALFLTAVLALRLILNGLCQRATTGSITLISWLVFAALAMGLSMQLTAASFIGVLPMLAFVVGAVLDGLLRKRYTQLLFARLFGFMAAVYLGCYFFFMLEVVVSFEHAALLIAPFILPLIAVLPLISANESRPGSFRWSTALIALPIVLACIGQQFIPGHTIDRPRAMNLVYRAIEGQEAAWWQLQGGSSAIDKHYAARNGFGPQTLVVPGRAQQEIIARPAQVFEYAPVLLQKSSQQDNGSLFRLALQLEIPAELRQLTLFLPEGLAYSSIRVAGVLALQDMEPPTNKEQRRAIVINRPAPGSLSIEINRPSTSVDDDLVLAARARFGLSDAVLQEALSGWPLDAQAQQHGHRAEVDFLLDTSTK
ncbi:MAG: M28 family peptidase [Xanthomonadales bacterium]|nr:M28 family peptidase [Xanthomonadales bacterium]